MNNPYSPPAAAPLPYPPGNYGAPQGGVSEGAVALLLQTRTWVRIISIFCFIGAGLMLLASVGMFIAGAVASAAASSSSPIPMAALGLVYMPFAALYIYPGIKLWMYANAIGRLGASRSTVDLEGALLQQKSFWKYSGISAIVMVVLYVLFFIGVMAFGVLQGMSAVH
jgi:hypothetical protein